MPAIVLPESATAADPDLSSVPYGSLRESQFAHPQYGGENRNNATLGGFNDSNSRNLFQPQSLPAYSGNCGLGAYLNNCDNSPRTNQSQGSGIGGLLNEFLGNDAKGVESVTGITDGCLELTLNEGTDNRGMNPYKSGDVAYNHENVNYGHSGLESNLESAPLSSSLTAFDILMRSRNAIVANSRGYVIARNTAAEHRNLTQQNLLQQTYYSSLPAQYTVEGTTNYDNDNDDRQTNPDTFEAFDLELDE